MFLKERTSVSSGGAEPVPPVSPVLPRQWKDPELAQAITRVIFIVLVGIFCWVRGIIESEPFFSGVEIASVVYFCYSTLHLAWVSRKPGKNNLRRAIAIVGDQGACTAAFLLGGESAFPFFAVYVWVCVGNGMRYGSNYMYLATAMGTVGFGVAVWLRDLAVTQFDIVLGIFGCIIAIPLFVRKLFAQLEFVNARLVEQTLQLQHEANHDRLTGLANRSVFFDRLSHLIASYDRQQVGFAVIYFDIDRFKSINDDYGHSVGDEWLRGVSADIAAHIRKGDDFCRLAGDEFVVLLEGAESEEVAIRVATTIQTVVRLPRTIDGHTIEVSASVGIALYPDGSAAEDARSVANRADIAMYYSKRNGRGRHTLYHPRLTLGL